MNVHISDTIKATVITRIAGEISMTEQQFDDILRKACNACMKEEVEYFFATDTTENIEFNHKLKRRMNRLFRIYVTEDYIPHPEVDTRYERAKAKTIEKFLLAKSKLKRI